MRLNSVSRYSKESSRLILEEHSHCEIPAGCGGAVLRWFNPLRALPVQFRMYVEGDVKFALDGKPTDSARPLVEYGEHVLSFVVNDFDTKFGILMFAASIESKVKRSPGEDQPPIRHVVLSDADGSWKYTLNAPKSDSWMAPGLDDTDWNKLVLKPMPKPDESSSGSYWHRNMLEMGAKGLGLEDAKWTAKLFGRAPSPERLWIRKVFDLTPPRERSTS